jgi:hypothetical protein
VRHFRAKRSWAIKGIGKAKILFACLCALLGGLALAQAETRAEKLRYIKDITGVSCSAEALAVRTTPNGPVARAIPNASVTVLRGQVDDAGESWVYVRDDHTRKEAGWARLLDLSCL